NIFPEGVGMGWLALMTESEWLVEFESAVTRIMFVDRSTKFSELFQSIAREHGLFISWDPSTAKVRLRTLSIPQAGNADTFTFSESNRSSPTDRTTQRLDLTNLRTSWKIQYGWDWSDQSYKSGPIVFNDVVARSNYPNNARQESIEDKTLQVGSDIGLFI